VEIKIAESIELSGTKFAETQERTREAFVVYLKTIEQKIQNLRQAFSEFSDHYSPNAVEQYNNIRKTIIQNGDAFFDTLHHKKLDFIAFQMIISKVSHF